ncbi:hypothetical protein [Thermomonospora cellulosilytica]|uniref:Crossover junction endodeoxyribonuclease RuvC n=1 Tax=Thermomonospora cellulosilytica TaxID=1411118 RepID=A0A7W3R8I2_9ACTN|nr:hypothetical protein [Thermomonospora cellulosilytica]MBA9003766.1 crossover junction endodeoxyribonuclease RuvC [Thermomonospora cellulosilytica]
MTGDTKDTRTGGEAGKAAAGPGLRVIGLDLSLTSTGLACHCGIHRIKSHPRLEITRFSRLRIIALGVMHHVLGSPEICTPGQRADLVVVEDLALSRSTGQHLTRAGLWHLVMNEVDNEGIPYVIVSPTSLKKYVTGRGNAGKDEVLAAAIRRWPDAPIHGNDEADAYALQAMGLDYLGHPPAAMPQTHRAVLDAIHWPEVAR